MRSQQNLRLPTIVRQTLRSKLNLKVSATSDIMKPGVKTARDFYPRHAGRSHGEVHYSPNKYKKSRHGSVPISPVRA